MHKHMHTKNIYIIVSWANFGLRRRKYIFLSFFPSLSHIYTYICICIYMCVCMYISICMYMYMYVCVYVRMYACGTIIGANKHLS